MKLRKPDKMEQNNNLKASRNAFIFYGVVLLIWSAYDVIAFGELSWQLVILFAGQIVFWLSRIFLRKNVESKKEKNV